MPTSPYHSAHTGAEVDDAVSTIQNLQASGAQGGLCYANATNDPVFTAALTGIVWANGSGAPTAGLPGTTANMTAGKLPKFASSAPYLTNSIITESGNTLLVNTATTGVSYIKFSNTSGQGFIGVEASLGGTSASSSSAYSLLITTTNSTPIELGINSAVYWRVTTAGAWQSVGANTITTTTGTLNITTGAGNGNIVLTPHGTGNITLASLTGMLKAASGVVSAVTGGTNRVTIWSDANTISSDANLTWSSSVLTAIGSFVAQVATGSTNTLLTLETTNTAANSSARLILKTGVAASTASNGNDILWQGGSGANMGQIVVNHNGSGGSTMVFGTRTNAGSLTDTWSITAAGILQANGAQTITTSTGNLTLATGAANGNILLSPHGTGIIALGGTVAGYGTSTFVEARQDANGMRLLMSDNQNTGSSAYGGIGLGAFGNSWGIRVGSTAANGNSIEFVLDTTSPSASKLTLSTAGVLSIPALTQKSVPFIGASGAVSQDNSNFQYDSSTVSFAVGDAADANQAIRVVRSGAKTASNYAIVASNTATSSTGSIEKAGIWVSSTGTWNGAGAVNFGILINAVSGGTTNWALYNNTAANVYLGTGNVGIGVTAWGSSAVSVLGIGNGTEPGSSPADMVQLYSVDLSAGNATLGIRTETAVAADVALASTHSLSVRINGATYKIPLTLVP